MPGTVGADGCAPNSECWSRNLSLSRVGPRHRDVRPEQLELSTEADGAPLAGWSVIPVLRHDAVVKVQPEPGPPTPACRAHQRGTPFVPGPGRGASPRAGPGLGPLTTPERPEFRDITLT